jgi:GxxExxY protein
MNADERRYKHGETTAAIIGVFFDVYNELGYGFLESVYREATIALRSEGLQVEKEFLMSARFRGQIVGDFKADLVVSGAVAGLLEPSETAWTYELCLPAELTICVHLR